jgi:hypothetical protein
MGEPKRSDAVESDRRSSPRFPADLLGKAFYPQVMRMDLTSKQPWKLMLRGTALVSFVMLLAILLIIVGGKPLLMIVFGKAFLGAYEPLVIMTAIPFLGIFGFPLTPMLYAQVNKAISGVAGVEIHERIARVYRHGRVLEHETRDSRVSIVADIPRSLVKRVESQAR